MSDEQKKIAQELGVEYAIGKKIYKFFFDEGKLQVRKIRSNGGWHAQALFGGMTFEEAKAAASMIAEKKPSWEALLNIQYLFVIAKSFGKENDWTTGVLAIQFGAYGKHFQDTYSVMRAKYICRWMSDILGRIESGKKTYFRIVRNRSGGFHSYSFDKKSLVYVINKAPESLEEGMVVSGTVSMQQKSFLLDVENILVEGADYVFRREKDGNREISTSSGWAGGQQIAGIEELNLPWIPVARHPTDRYSYSVLLVEPMTESDRSAMSVSGVTKKEKEEAIKSYTA